MTEEPATINAVSSALASNGQLLQENVCRDVGGLSTRLSETEAAAALVDIDFQPARVLAAIDPLVRRFPETKFIVVASTMDPRLIVEAMGAGARHFMTKAELASGLREVIRRLCYGGPASTGQMVSVFSASGGCGATTVAVNLAWELQSVTEKAALLVDLDYAYGAVGAYLGVEGTYGVMDLQDRAGAIDPELIRTTSMPYHERLRVLVAANPSRLGMGGDYRRLMDMLGGCVLTSPLVVVDAPRLPLSVACELARTSAVNLLVMQLTVKDVRSARHFLTALRNAGLPPEGVTLLVNRYRRRSSLIELDEARRALEGVGGGGVKIECLSNDFAGVSESINMGRPLEQVAGRSAVRKELQALARALTVQGRLKGVTA
jgi:pilus assembly protein CpaE